MDNNTKDHVAFRRLEFTHDHGLFEFSDKRTLIVGQHGAGKSTLVHYLSSLNGTHYSNNDASQIKYSVLTEGDRLLIHKYSHLIFINYEYSSHIGTDLFSKNVDSMANIKEEVSLVLKELYVEKPWNMDKCHDLNINTLAFGERVCLFYAYIFAVRNLMEIRLPLVLDSPFGSLDRELRNGLSRLLNKDDSQQIFLLTPSEYELSLGLGKIDYTLKGFPHV